MTTIPKVIEGGKVQIPDGYKIVPKGICIWDGDLFTTPSMDTWNETRAIRGTYQNPLSMKVYIREHAKKV